MRVLRPFWVVFFLSVLATPVAAAEATFVTPDRLDLTKVLPSAPELASEQQKRDMAAVMATQKTRKPPESNRALADAKAGAFGFADVLGPDFNAEHLPMVAALLGKVRGDAAVAFSAGKNAWKRPRPYETSNKVHSLGEPPGGSSYPSGASTAGYLTAIVLANMVPEKATELYRRGREFGDDRVILGVHYPSDVEAGRLAATALAAVLMQDQAFLKEFDAAKQELRSALKL